MALTEHDAAVMRCQQQHDAAKQRAMDMHGDAVRARQEATEASTVGEMLIAQVANGEAETDDDALLAAADQARRAEALAAISEAKAAAAMRQREVAEIALLKAKGDALAAEYERCVTRELQLSDELDSLVAATQDHVALLMKAQNERQAAYMKAASHNQMLNPGHIRNATLATLPIDQQPRAEIPPNNLGVITVRAELFSVVGAGFNAGQKNPVHSMSGRMHQAHGRARTLPKAEAAA